MPRKPKILVVDDDPAIRNLLWGVLSRAGYEVLLAEDGIRGIELAWQQKPRLVITDALLPKMHGFLVCRKIKSFPEPPRVVILTGVYTKPYYSWEARDEYGADALMTKPFDLDDLLVRLSEQMLLAA